MPIADDRVQLVAICCHLLARLSGGRWADAFYALKLRVWWAGIFMDILQAHYVLLASSGQIEVKFAVWHD
jgi:hypothetical protein